MRVVLLPEVVDRAADSSPDAPAVLVGDRVVTFAQLRDRMRRAAALTRQWCRPDTTLAVVGENDQPWIDAYYGVPAAGRVLTFLNHRLAPGELVSMATRAGVSVIVGAERSVEAIRNEWGATGPDAAPRFVTFPEWEAAIDATDPDVETPPATGTRATGTPTTGTEADPAWLLFTSGTTAQPKGVLLTHRSLLAATAATDSARPIAPDDVYLFPFPLCHVAGYNALRHHQHHRPVVLVKRFTPASFVAAVAATGATSTSLAATMLAALLDYLDANPAAARDLATLRSVAYGAAPMPTELLQRAHDTLGVSFAQGYGMTELSGNAVFLDEAAHTRGLAGEPRLLAGAGWPAPGVEVRIVDESGRAVPVGEAGEIQIRADQVMAGYLEGSRPESGPGSGLVDGWLPTGDVGRLAADGLLSVVDRKKDLIVTGGENVSSLEVEAVIRRFPGVRDVAVVGVADPTWGENVCAVLTREPDDDTDFDADALVTFVRTHLAGFKSPRHVVVLDTLPVNSSGKVDKAALRRLLAGHRERLGSRR